MKIPTPVSTRRMALIAELGFDPHLALEDGFDEKGFEVIGEDDQGVVRSTQGGELLKTFIRWPDHTWETRAVEAMRGDFDEKFGSGTSDQLDKLAAATHPNNQMVVNQPLVP